MIGRALAHGAAAALVVAGLAAQVFRPLAPELGLLPLPERWFDAAHLERVAAYHRPLYAVALVALAVRVVVPCLAAFSKLGRRHVESMVVRVGARRPARAAAAVIVAVVALTDLVLLPIAFWAGYVHERAFGFQTQGPAGWFRDWALATAISWLTVALLALAGWTLVRRLPGSWPAAAGLTGAVLTAVIALGSPLVLEPLFLNTRSLEPGPVRAEVGRVLGAADLEVGQILVADASHRTTKENAYVSGLGATRRIVLYDTLLAGRSPPEVGIVLAHELGHVRNADLVRAVLLAGAGTVTLIYALAALVRWRARGGRQDGQADPRAAAVALAAVVIAGVLAMPIQQAASRRIEAAADLAALNLAQDPSTYVSMNLGLARSNLTDPAPPAWVTFLWKSHPPPVARLAMGERWPFA
ncbi:MAG: M48 family metalloprotease [Egibacteraceae bacterium]